MEFTVPVLISQSKYYVNELTDWKKVFCELTPVHWDIDLGEKSVWIMLCHMGAKVTHDSRFTASEHYQNQLTEP